MKLDADEITPIRYADATADDPRVLAWLEQWLTGWCDLDPDTPRTLVLTGSVGAGKTWQAYGALRWIAAADGAGIGTGEAWLAPKLLRELTTATGKQRGELLERVSTTDVLLLDDLGAMRWSEPVEDLCFELIDRRDADALTTIVTSNFRLDRLADVLGDRTVSRLWGSCGEPIELTGPDRRRTKGRKD